MIMFDCPSCKTKLQVADEHAGKTIQCPKCKEKAVVPQTEAAAALGITEEPVGVPSSAPDAVTTPDQVKPARKGRDRGDDDDGDDRPRRRRRDDDGDMAKKAAVGMGAGATVAIVLAVGACVCLGVGAVLVALLVPAVQKVREAAARTQSTNNLKQISLAFQSFQDANQRLPFNGTRPAVGGDPTTGSWGFQILPYMEQFAIYQNVDHTLPVPMYMCPGRGRPMVETTNGGGAWTDYFYNNYLNDPTQASKPNAPDFKRTLVGITDGTSNTICVGHGNINTNQYPLSGNVTLSTNILMGGTTGTMRAGDNAKKGQGSPTGVTLQRDSTNNPVIGSWGGPFPQGGLMAMVDGTVRMFPYSTQNFSAFLTPDGGENVFLP